MAFCRPAWRTIGPLAHRSAVPLRNSVISARSLAYGLPGGTGQKLARIVLCGGSLAAAAAAIYAYKTVIPGREKFADRVANIDAKPSESQPWQAEISPEPADVPAVTGQAAGAGGRPSRPARTDSLLPEPQHLESVPVNSTTEEPSDPTRAETVAAEPVVGAESAERPAEDTASSPAEYNGTPPAGQEAAHPDQGAARTPEDDVAVPAEA